MTYFRQCQLQKGDLIQISWIPEFFAVIGAPLRLRDDGVWVDGWIVREVWQRLPEDQLPDSHAERAAHKRATGDVA